MVKYFLPVLLVLAGPAIAAKPAFPPSSGQSGMYGCADGRTIEVLYSGGDAAVVTVGGASVQLSRAAADQGERYTGSGLQWWGMGPREGRLGAASGDGSGTRCAAR